MRLQAAVAARHIRPHTGGPCDQRHSQSGAATSRTESRSELIRGEEDASRRPAKDAFDGSLRNALLVACSQHRNYKKYMIVTRTERYRSESQEKVGVSRGAGLEANNPKSDARTESMLVRRFKHSFLSFFLHHGVRSVRSREAPRSARCCGATALYVRCVTTSLMKGLKGDTVSVLSRLSFVAAWVCGDDTRSTTQGSFQHFFPHSHSKLQHNTPLR